MIGKILIFLFKLFGAVVAFFVLSWISLVAIMLIGFTSKRSYSTPMGLMMLVFYFGWLVLILRLLWQKTWLSKIGGWLLGLSFLSMIVFSAGYHGYAWYSKGRFAVVGDDIPIWDYHPFEAGNLLKSVDVCEDEKIRENFPTINGAYALYPIYAAMTQALYAEKENPNWFNDVYDKVKTGGSDRIFQELLSGNVDMIFAAAPSKKQMEAAQAAGVTFTMIPFAKEAFVFFVNKKNPVENLTVEQIRAIYSGKATHWNEVGQTNHNDRIIAFQRNEGSGSQTMLQKIMQGVEIMPPLQEDRVGGMGKIIIDTAEYRNYRAALGFSFRYFATEMFYNEKIKLISINGIYPSIDTIVNDTYPFTGTCFIIMVKPPTPQMQKIIDFMVSKKGQDLVKRVGYVPYVETK